ncbi:MAG: hypothetical protein JSR82_20790 [Verrucomicrobia bacterium]|nr:hypothetical protein [Verrucomicrobiota bacterium]
MDLPTAAAEHLGTIRRLMERATVYRALSAPGAAVAGLLALLVGGLQIVFHRPPSRGAGIVGDSMEDQAAAFIVPWLAVLLTVLLVNVWLLWREARRRNEVFFSAGMRTALRQMVPPLLAGGLITVGDYLGGTDPIQIVVKWLLFYGLALLATTVFAPRSIVGLGGAFFGAALACVVTRLLGFGFDPGQPNFVWAAWLMMGTFGFFHLLYAAFAWKSPDEAAA